MKKIIRRTLRVVIGLVLVLTVFYYFAKYEKPINQKALGIFLLEQTIIDVHLHILGGNPDDELYNQYDEDINQAVLKFTQQEFDKHNIVIALGGGPIPYS